MILPEHELVVVHRADSSTRKWVREEQIGVLLWMILDAAGIPNGDPPPVAIFDAGNKLGGQDLENILGNSKIWVDTNAESVDIIFTPEGKVNLVIEERVVDRGTWTVEEEDFCLVLQSFDGLPKCGVVFADGELIRFYDELGFLALAANYDD